ncbi:uncharacterized protein LOC125681241 [Ostrea edulis]|uniref:uncharacterized protein LOC125681241 n=1 Tax=Ostrea edulis TaxID=37623 RepID=UPI0024AEDB26|nr:uncharacterized protein LOC125681241 [Ostrea edulis]
MSRFVVYFLFAGFLRNLVAPIRCYECDLIGNKSSLSCFDPLDPTHDDVRVTKCQNSRETCLKIKTTFQDGDVFFQRKCGKAKQKDSCKNLKINGTKYLLTVELCSCETDLCNKVDHVSTFSQTVISAVTILWVILNSM